MAKLEPGSVQCVITSPPYFGLRDYGTPPQTWGTGWVGSLGLEPYPEMFIEHLSEVFSYIWRILRPDGTVWLNLGDSYAGSGKGPTGHNGIGDAGERQGFTGNPGRFKTSTLGGGQSTNLNQPGRSVTGFGLKPKDLMFMPERVAMRLQQDGWWVRSKIPWLKRNPMPESADDRPTTATEWVYLLAKSENYYWDAEAVRMGQEWIPPKNEPTRGRGYGEARSAGGRREADRDGSFGTGSRHRRTHDWFLESWQGLILNEQGDPLGLLVNPNPYHGAHFATSPPKLVEPMIKSSTSEKGKCPACGAPWSRAETTGWRPTCEHGSDWLVSCGACNGTGWIGDPPSDQEINAGPFDHVPSSQRTNGVRCTECQCGKVTATDYPEPRPCVVLDPFGGSGTVAMVADRLSRDAIVCELSTEYGDLITERLYNDGPMFLEMSREQHA